MKAVFHDLELNFELDNYFINLIQVDFQLQIMKSAFN